MSCIHCGVDLFNDILMLVEHSKTCSYMHRNNKSFTYVCVACNYHSELMQNMKRHLRMHTGDKPFKCTICSYKSGRKDNLLTHMKIRHNLSFK